MQNIPLLEQIDWFFTSCEWTLKYPNTVVQPLAKITSDHVPCVVTISTKIPKARIFRFENMWIEQPGFYELVERVWNMPVKPNHIANMLTAKFKNLRHELKKWGKSLSHLKHLIENCNKVVLLLDELEEHRALSTPEFNFRNTVKVHIKKLLSI
jgi:hypothetical protein